MYNWNRIQTELMVNIEKVFTGTIEPVFTDFKDSLDLFFRVILVKCNKQLIDGLTRSILPALYQAYVTNPGNINPLKILSEELEPFYKKLLILIKNRDYTQNRAKTLGPLMEELQLSQIINTRSVGFSELFDESTVLNYIGQDEYLEYLCRSYIIRNQVHNSPDWDYVEVFTNLRSIVVAYLYPVLKYRKEISDSISSCMKIDSLETDITVDNQTKALYEFISLGNNTVEIKKQILNSSILYFLLSNETASIGEIMEYCNNQFNSNADISFYTRTTNALLSEGKVVFDHSINKLHKLSDKERDRLQKAISNFDFLEKNFMLSVQQILSNYSLDRHTNDIITNLKTLLETNYDTDLYEIYNQIAETTNNENRSIYIKYLDSITKSRELSDKVFFELLRLCEENDYLHRISASKVISSYINSNQLQNYLRLQERVIYMDTQLLLYILCIFYKEVKDYNIYYNITLDLIKYSESNPNVSLNTSILYVYEAAYHFKEALLLIPFEDLDFYEPKNSHNVFFQYYEYLSNNDLLEDDVKSFEDFLAGFELVYEDVFSTSFIQTVARLITSFLESFNINIENIHKASNQAYEESFNVFKNVLNTLGRPRQEITIENDATMLFYLTNKYSSDQEPFFITWDHTFYEARKRYLEKSKGCKNFYLYTPSKLLTNLSLTKFEINPEGVTREFMSILDADDIQTKTSHLLDIISQLFDIDRNERRKYLSKLKEFKAKYIIDQEIQIDEGSSEEKTQPYSALLSELANQVSNSNSLISMENLKALLSNEEFFEPLTSIFDKELGYYTLHYKFSNSFLKDVNALIKKMQMSK